MPANIHPTALVSGRAELGPGVTVGPFTIIGDGVVLGDGCTVGSHCEIGVAAPNARSERLIIGAGSLIRSHSCFYAGSDFSGGIRTGHSVTVREHTTAGRDFQLGTLSDIQGDCEIGDYVRTHSNVHIGKHSKVGSFVWLFPYVVLTNDPHPPSDTMLGVTVEDYVAIACMSVILPGVTLGRGCLVGAGSTVSRDVPAGMIVASPASELRGPAAKIKLRDGTDRSAYPWPAHFRRGYPEHVQAGWDEEFGVPGGADEPPSALPPG